MQSEKRKIEALRNYDIDHELVKDLDEVNLEHLSSQWQFSPGPDVLRSPSSIASLSPCKRFRFNLCSPSGGVANTCLFPSPSPLSKSSTPKSCVSFGFNDTISAPGSPARPTSPANKTVSSPVKVDDDGFLAFCENLPSNTASLTLTQVQKLKSYGKLPPKVFSVFTGPTQEQLDKMESLVADRENNQTLRVTSYYNRQFADPGEEDFYTVFKIQTIVVFVFVWLFGMRDYNSFKDKSTKYGNSKFKVFHENGKLRFSNHIFFVMYKYLEEDEVLCSCLEVVKSGRKQSGIQAKINKIKMLKSNAQQIIMGFSSAKVPTVDVVLETVEICLKYYLRHSGGKQPKDPDTFFEELEAQYAENSSCFNFETESDDEEDDSFTNQIMEEARKAAFVSVNNENSISFAEGLYRYAACKLATSRLAMNVLKRKFDVVEEVLLIVANLGVEMKLVENFDRDFSNFLANFRAISFSSEELSSFSEAMGETEELDGLKDAAAWALELLLGKEEKLDKSFLAKDMFSDTLQEIIESQKNEHRYYRKFLTPLVYRMFCKKRRGV
jgi:hypothetical protein